MAAVSAGSVYYDPGIKMEAAGSAKPLIKRRSQFRVRHADLNALYRGAEEVAIT
ncbi:hypothetical protein [Loktanella sp. M215]|uniref:hypothetical protein n=1 Tax=Loktanella sp. M215 TaxID=2675431 RepID=UPI003FA59704